MVKWKLTERIGYFLDTGNISDLMSSNKSKCQIGIITEDSKIEENFVCSQKHRVSLKKNRQNFFFNVPFQNGLKTNTGKIYLMQLKHIMRF
mgnify:CR=1 FL=1